MTFLMTQFTSYVSCLLMAWAENILGLIENDTFLEFKSECHGKGPVTIVFRLYAAWDLGFILFYFPYMAVSENHTWNFLSLSFIYFWVGDKKYKNRCHFSDRLCFYFFCSVSFIISDLFSCIACKSTK